MNKKEKEDIIHSWNEVEEAIQNIVWLESSTELDKEQKTVIGGIAKRLQEALDTLGDYFTDEESQAYMGRN